MKHTYKITGMTCNGCRAHVEKTLNEVEGVQKARVSLEDEKAEIEMKEHIPINKLEEALVSGGGNYHIMMPDEYGDSSGKPMTHTYRITGMTCNGCRSHVEKILNEVDGVIEASVNLEKAEAEISMKKHIEIEKFEAALQEGGGIIIL